MMTLNQIPGAFDVVVIGGGITGAGVFRRAAERGLRCLLVEQRDFAWGTSSRSAKLVHGGLRYMVQGQLRTSYDSVRQRERLLGELPGLVDLIDFAFAPPIDGLAAQVVIEGMLRVWDFMGGRPNHRRLDPEAFSKFLPALATQGRAGFVYGDGQTDDARLVLRILQQGRAHGGVTLNYTRVAGLGRRADGTVATVELIDDETKEAREIESRVVINATGAWADDLRRKMGCAPVIRRLRGSHLVIPQTRLPLPCAVAFQSPEDKRNMYAVPWEGVVLVGTTDLDHADDLSREPYMTPDEGEYLLQSVQAAFPEAGLVEADIQATQAGVRPVIGSGKADPSREARDALVVADQNMITLSGGKLTTFDLMAQRAMTASQAWLQDCDVEPATETAPAEPMTPLDRIGGRFGPLADRVRATGAHLEPIARTSFSGAEARWSAEHEQVRHLDDLLLRRTRLGLILPRGGLDEIETIRSLVSPALGWSPERWTSEIDRYRRLWASAYSPERLRSHPNQPRAAAG